jgi:uncharacterized membrane protein required for colicin V production
MFILGYVQGVVRRLIGIFTVTFSFILAANLRGPVGDFLVTNWTQFPPEYSRMIGFGIMFVAAVLATALITQMTFKPMLLWPRAPVVEEIVGGLLGVVQGLVIVLALIVITDPFFVASPTESSNELPFLRGVHDALNPSVTARIYRETVIPGFNTVLGGLLPDAVKDPFAGSGR